MVLETERLLMREWRESDLDCYMALSEDVGYNCFTHPGRFSVRNAGQAKQKIRERINLFDERKLGKFPIFLKHTGEFIGTCGIAPFDFNGQPEVELGYRLCLNHWGRGYATEAAIAALRYGFADLRLNRILAFALPQNSASLRVLEKLGAVYLQDFAYAGLTHRLFDVPGDKFGG
jgi:ribosomal-protein-alanine N-acetyltransferase